MKIIAIIQARMGSSRLPGKVLLPLAGKPVIERVVQRVARANAFDEIIVATSTLAADDHLAATAASTGASVVRGDELDVLGRFQTAVAASDAQAILRITADCPLIDPGVLSNMAQLMRGGADADLVTNARVRTYPRGLDAELFTRRAFDEMAVEATASHEREHVTPFFYAHPGRFRILDVVHNEDLSRHRWTLDTPEDYEFLRLIHEAAARPDELSLDETLRLLAGNPAWREINARVEQKHI